MRLPGWAVLAALPSLLLVLPELPGTERVADSGVDTVHVAPPTGTQDRDRASILAALERAEPGGTVQFAKGLYLVGTLIPVTDSGVTLLGHPEGTTLRGCDPTGFVEIGVALFACNGLELRGARQTVRNFTIEYAWHGLFVGCCFPSDSIAMRNRADRQRAQPGGHLIEGNTFRYSSNGIRVVGESSEPTVIRDNLFINVYHAIGINGRTTHFLNNEISVTEPKRVPISGHPGGAIGVTPFGEPGDHTGDHTSCAGNVVAGNRIEGHPDAIAIYVFAPGMSCRRNVIRDNTIEVRRVRVPASWLGIKLDGKADSTVVGVPISLINVPASRGGAGQAGQAAAIEDNLIEGNRVLGAEGIGIEVLHASRNRIVGNTISGIRRRDPFPGNVLGGPLQWRDAAGAAIWVSAGSDENAIAGNTFAETAAAAVVLQGNRNRVELRTVKDSVRDLGTGNRVAVQPAQ